jgi:hypothetical protein
MRLQAIPPLSHDSAWIEVIVTGHSAEARATLPLRWKQRPLPGQRLKRGGVASGRRAGSGLAHVLSGLARVARAAAVTIST